MKRRSNNFLLAIGLLLAGCAGRDPPPMDLRAVFSEPPPTSSSATTAPAPQPDLPVGATLADLLRWAEENHPALREAAYRWQAMREQVPQQRSLPDPMLELSYEDMDRESRIGLSQGLPFPGKLSLRAQVAEAAAAAARQELAMQRREVLREVAEAYAELAYLNAAVDVSQRNLALAQQLVQVAEAAVRAGGTQADLLRAQIELARRQEEQQAIQDQLRPASAMLNAALGRPDGAPLPAVTLPADGGRATDEAIRRRLETSPELEALRLESERAGRMVALARREFWPDFEVGAEYMRDPMEDGFGVMFGVNIPVWQGRYRAALREALREQQAAEQAILDRYNDLTAQLERALFDLRDAERKLALYRDTLLPAAEQSMRVTEAAYRAGDVDFLAVLEAYRLPLEFELALARALADRGMAIARIEALAGSAAEAGTNDTNEVQP